MSSYTEHNVLDAEHNALDDQDIYRGEPPHHVDVVGGGPAPSIMSSLSSSTDSSSSSSSFMGGGRLGAIAAKLELAISRWGRNVRGASSISSGASTTSSSSSSSSSSRSSIVTLTKSQMARRRRKRRSSQSRAASSLRSERDIAARISRMKAIEKSREIGREFALYLPPSIAPTPLVPGSPDPTERADKRITWTKSLPLVLHQLGLATRRPARAHRGRGLRGKRGHSEGPADLGGFFEGTTFEAISSLEVEASTSVAVGARRTHRGRGTRGKRGRSADPERLFSEHEERSAGQVEAITAARRGKKGKQRAVPRNKPTTILEELAAKPEAWFLDVANPTWEDLRAIGKVLHIHPLTLEDILQQDPREKLEIFGRLGYYFISFRAIESQATREKIRREVGVKDGYEENSIGEANVYLTVFKTGICCFHFTDVSEHTDRVRNRMVLLEQVVTLSSDWIAHGILDSIVDSFFPVLNEIEKEVTAIDYLVYNIGTKDAYTSPPPSLQSDDTNVSLEMPKEEISTPVKKESSIFYTPAEELRNAYRPRFVSPRLSPRLLIRRLRRQIHNAWNKLWVRSEPPPSERQETLRRMARTRKQVTVLGRLLASKADVVTQIRKRLSKAASEMPGSDELEVAIYMGDVEDHILTLQHALAHYERMLSQSHPTYLAQLRAESEGGKGSVDMNILYLSTVSIGSLCVGPLIGSCSMNVNIITNLPGNKLNVFAVVVSLSAVIMVMFLLLVKYWWRQAKKKTTTRI